MNQDIQQQDPGVRRPIIRRVIIMLVTFLMSFIVLAAVGIISSLELRLTDETASTLSLTEDALREKITQYRRDVRLIVTSPDLQKFVINDNDPINEITVPEALSTAATLVTLHNDEYQAVRYIVTDDAPRITLEVNNISGVPIFSSNEQLALLSATRQAADPVFQALQNGSITGVQLSDIYLLQNADGNDSVVPVMSVYQPVVYQTSELAGILELQIDMQQFLATVNNAENTLFTALTGRRLLLVNEAYRLLADSRNQTRYLSRFDDVALPVSEYDFMIAELDANDTRAWSDRNFVYRIAGQQIAFDEASTVWHLIYIDEFVSAYRPAILAIVSIISLSILLGIAAYSVLTRQISQILQPVYLASGLIQDLATATGVNTRPENSAPLDKLEQVSRNVENRIRDLNSTIESEQIQRRRDLQLVRRVSYAINDPQSAYDVPVHAVKVITTELNISSAVIYRLDTSRTHIQTIAAYHHNDEQIPDTAISVDTKTFVGTVIRRNHPIIIADTLQSVYQDNSRHLPETRSELGLPLIIEGTLPGALILQSNEIDAFSEVDLPVYQLIADQLATAMFNQGLQDTAAQRFEQVKHLNQQLTARAWAETGNRDQLADKYGTLPDNGSLAAPITVRGQVIGSLDAALPDNRDLTAGDKVVLSAVAERVSLAVENARLFQETQHSLAETSTLYQLSRQLTETGNLEDILRVVIISVAPDAVGGQIWLFDEYLPGDEPDIVRLAIDLPVNDRNYNLQDIMLRMREEPLLSGIQADQILAIPDIAQKARSGEGQLSELFEVLDVESVMIFPLNIRNRWKGFVSIDFADARQFTESERRIYNTLIGQAGVAIDNRLLIQQTENALSRNEKLYAASRIINTAAGLDDLVYAALSTTNDHALSFWLALLEDGTENDRGWATRARIVARSDKDDVDTTEIIYDLPLTDHSPLYNREPEVIVDPGYEAGDVSPSVEWMRSMNLQFMMAFPLFSENTPIALFYIVSETPYVLTSEDYEVYSALTGQMSTRIQSQRFLESTRKALSDVQRLYAATRALTAATDLEDLYSAIAGHLARPFLTGQHSGLQLSITLLQAAPRPQTTAPYLEYIYEWHTQPDTPPLFEIGTKLPHQDYPFGELSRNFEENTFIYGDIVAEVINTGLQTILQGHQSQSAIVAPLHYRQSWYGVLICRSNQPQLFDESYANFMQAIASQVAVAFERQELVAENDRERQNLNDILSTLSAGVLVLDPDTLIPVQANDAASELLGQPIDYNHPFTAAHYDIYRTGTNLHYPDSELPVMLARQLNRSVPGDDLAVIFDDYRIDLQISAAPIYDESNRMKAIVAAFLDISNLRGLENTLQEQLRESVSLYEALRSLSQSESLAELLDNILLQLTLQQPEDAYILRVDENAENLRVERELVQAIQPIEALAPLLITEHANYVPDVQLEAGINDSLRNILDEAGIRSIITLPMFARSLQIPIGWLVLCSGYPHDFSPEQERTLVSISDMASTAIDNRYLMEQTESALDETAALYGANTSISRASDLDELSIALQRGLAGMQPDMYAAYLTLDDGETIGELFSIGFEESIAAGMDMNTLVTGKLNSGDTMYVADITRSTLGTVEREIIKAGNIISFAAINIRLKDVNSGRLIVGYKTRRNFGSSDARFLTAIAGSASVVINNEILLGQVQTALQETSILYQASRSLIEVSTPEEIMEAITTHLIEPHVNQVYIMMLNTTSWDHPAASVEIVSSWQQDSDIDLLDVTLTPEQFPAWTQLSSSEVLTIHDIYDSDPEIDLLEQTSIESLDTRSLVVIPLRVASRAIGAIWMGSREAHRYPDDRQRIFQAFSEQSSLSLEATRLLEQTEQRAAQLETSAVISRSVGQILDLDILLPQVVDLIKAQFKYDQVQIFLMDNENNRAVLQASTGESGLQLLAVNHSLAIGSQSIIGQVTATGQPAVALDTADASVIHKPNPYLPLTRSEMAMPLLAKNEIVGALDVQSNEPDAFTDEDIQALTALAAQISVAIDNARLYEEAQRQAMDMNFLFEMTALVASMESIDDALTLLAERLEDNLNALSVAMYLPQVYADYQDNTITRMRLVTLTGQSSAYPSDFDEIEVGAGDNIVGIVSDTLQAYHVINVSEDVLYTPFVRTARSAYIVPVSSANNIISVIVIESNRSDAFDTSVQQLVQTLAGSMAAVIQSILLVEQLQESNDQLREVDRLKSQFLAAMSHELRTPLNSIIGFSRVMLKGIDGPLTEMQEQDLTTIYDSGNHLLNLVNDILDQAKIQNDDLTLKLDYFEVKHLVEGVKSMAIGYMKQKNDTLNLAVEIASNMPAAYGDEFRTRQIVMNLVSNAIKFTTEGTVTIRAYAQPYEDNTFIRIDIIDSGIGIAEEDISILFEEFRQVDNSLTRNAEGTGLGLPISKALAELQNGALIVESQINVGSVFSTLIPTQPLEGEEHDDESDESPAKLDVSKITGELESVLDPATQPVSNKIRKVHPGIRRTRNMMPVKREIVLVEDQKEMVDQFRRVLQKEGFEIQTADMPAYARAMVGTMRPTLVILDVNYGDGEGWNVLKDLKEQDATFDIPIIVSTTSTESEEIYQLGANYYLERPVTPTDLLETVLLAEQESRRERILIIDDEPASVRLLSQVLGEYGNYRVFSAKNGVEGISMVARRRPDLIILDLRMPEMDGFAVLEELYNNPETANIPVMVVTGDIDFNADEQEQLQHIHVLPKTHISQEEYDQFLKDVRNHLNPGD